MFYRNYRNKLNAKRTSHNGTTYASKLEARTKIFLEKYQSKLFPVIKDQVRIPLCISGKKVCDYVIDFVVTLSDGQSLLYVESKGFWTDAAKLKIKFFLALYPEVEYRVVNDYSLKLLYLYPEHLITGEDCHTQVNPFNHKSLGRILRK